MFQWLAIALLAVAASAAFIGADRVLESLQSDGEEKTAQTSPVAPEAEAETPAKRQAPAVVSFFNQLFDPEPEPTAPEPASGAESGEISQTAAPSTAAPSTAASSTAAPSAAAPTDPASVAVTAANGGDLYGPPEPGSPAAMPPTVTQAVSQAQVPAAPSIAPASVGTETSAPEAGATTAGSPEASGEAAPDSSTPAASESETPIPALW
ncbi:MAG: hypothetical protein ACO331_16460 [Prochlorothrix sp.]